MPEYIEKETALQIIDNYVKIVTEDGLVVVNAIKDIVSVICPTADVEPVKHSFWKNNNLYLPNLAECDVCGYEHYNTDEFKYCPNCGAKMDGEEVQE